MYANYKYALLIFKKSTHKSDQELIDFGDEQTTDDKGDFLMNNADFRVKGLLF